MEDIKLTPKQKAFADYYIQTGNGTLSAIRAGYSENAAKEISSENLTKPNIKSYIKKHLDAMSNKRIADAKEVLEYLTSVMRGEEKDQLGLDAALQDRTKAAELLGKRYRLFTEKTELKADVNQTIQFVDDLDELEDKE